VLLVTLPLELMLAATKLDDPHLGMATLTHHLSGDPGAVEQGGPHLDVSVRRQHQHLIELNRVAGLDRQFFNPQGVPRADTILFAAGHNNGI